MKGFIGILAVVYLFHHADGAVTFTGPGTISSNAATVSLAETSVETDTLFTVVATTDVASGSVTFAFVSDGNPDSIATLTGGVVKLAASKTLDKETKSSYTFKITGADTAPSTATVTVVLTVTNRLEFAKTSYEVCVADGTVAGTVIGTYTAVDVVSGTDTVTYTNTPTTDLTVDASTGALKVATGKTLTSAQTGGYTTTITATAATVSGSSAPGTTEVKVTVGGCSGAEGAITFSSPSPTTISAFVETSTAGTALFTVTATGGTASYTYSFVTADGNPSGIAAIDASTGEVTLATSKTIDYETNTQLVFKVVAVDSASTKKTATVTVTLSVKNMLEFSAATYAACFNEGATAGTVIGTFTVQDAVANTDAVTYSNTPSTDLAVDSSTGALKVATGKTLTSATSGGYSTTITADSGANTAASVDGTTVVTVTVCSGAGPIQFMAILLLIPLLLTRIF
ncbi:hypothetical protein DPMN_190237 [Dreissena polymorpha]|uniref:Cadherin domain-containing protein n=1 Tax=Dreissena polymorpha TaxID=45954 RepID=A0A9D4DUA3_DREPO|nr:hypothetical protein DPMN_190237 [Dreissena polymorpha]